MNYLFVAHDAMSTARSILREGYVDNELPLVVKENGRLVILEGNRRLSALRGLLTPQLVPAFQSDLEALLRRYPLEAEDLPETVRVMRFPNREAAAPVLARLHIGESKRRWGLDEQAKFVFAQIGNGVSVKELKEQLPAIKDVVRLIRMGNVREMLIQIDYRDPSLAAYAAGSDLAMSAFEYAYRNAEIQTAIGISFDSSGNLTTRPSTSAHVAALSRLLRGFLAGELNSRRGLKPGTQEFSDLLTAMREASLPASLEQSDSAGSSVTDDNPSRETSSDSPPVKPTENPSANANRATGRGNGGTPAAKSQPADTSDSNSPRRGPNSPETRRTLDFSGIEEEHLPLPLKHRLRELRRVDVVEFPAAATMLMRSVLEASIKEHYGLKHGPAATGTLGDVMKTITADYEKVGHLSHAIATVNSTKKGASTTPGTGMWFNLVAHSVHIDVDSRQVHQAWRLVFPLVRFLLMP
ncbi:hypothetical protein [Frankia canadensis]|nr:hypothetical protein [Frankia canadensis]